MRGMVCLALNSVAYVVNICSGANGQINVMLPVAIQAAFLLAMYMHATVFLFSFLLHIFVTSPPLSSWDPRQLTEDLTRYVTDLAKKMGSNWGHFFTAKLNRRSETDYA